MLLAECVCVVHVLGVYGVRVSDIFFKLNIKKNYDRDFREQDNFKIVIILIIPQLRAKTLCTCHQIIAQRRAVPGNWVNQTLISRKTAHCVSFMCAVYSCDIYVHTRSFINAEFTSKLTTA